jgi:hypothetical protein
MRFPRGTSARARAPRSTGISQRARCSNTSARGTSVGNRGRRGTLPPSSVSCPGGVTGHEVAALCLRALLRRAEGPLMLRRGRASENDQVPVIEDVLMTGGSSETMQVATAWGIQRRRCGDRRSRRGGRVVRAVSCPARSGFAHARTGPSVKDARFAPCVRFSWPGL